MISSTPDNTSKEVPIVLRRYIHRDIFTTYSSHHRVPQNINFRESYLVHRDDDDAQVSCTSPGGVTTDKRKSLRTSFNFREEEDRSDYSSDSRDYSAPSSASSSPKQRRSESPLSNLLELRDEHYAFYTPDSLSAVKPDVQQDCHSFADKVLLNPETIEFETGGGWTKSSRYNNLQPRLDNHHQKILNQKSGNFTKTSSLEDTVVPNLSSSMFAKYSNNEDYIVAPASSGVAQAQADKDVDEFDFLSGQAAPVTATTDKMKKFSYYGSHQVDPSRQMVKQRRRSTISKSTAPPSLSSSPCGASDDSSASSSPDRTSRRLSMSPGRNNPSPEAIRSSSSLSPSAKIDAGIPPKVPRHEEKKPANEWQRSHQPSLSEGSRTLSSVADDDVTPVLSGAVYTRKCSYRKPKQILQQDTAKKELTEVSEAVATPISASADPRAFMLPGYDELNTKLYVLNPDSRKTSYSSLASMVKTPQPRHRDNARTPSYADFLNQDHDIWGDRAEAFASKLG